MNPNSQTSPLVAELQRLKQWFEDRRDRPGCTAQAIHVGMALDAYAKIPDGPDERSKAALALIAELGDGEYSTEYDGRMVTCCLDCSASEDEKTGVVKHTANCVYVRAAALSSATSERPA